MPRPAALGRLVSGTVPWLVLALVAGCAVPQPRGEGLYRKVQEPTTKAWYHLYLPVDYVRNNGRHPDPRMRKWPLVMTFHGMKPYDNALPQEREWEKEADVYGYIVCAPELATSDSFMEYPLTKEHDYVLRDKRNVIAIMNHVFATTRADPRRVLSTSWSCGGYLAHYFPNRFPDRFMCIATRLSNFSASLLVEQTVPLYKDKTAVAIFIGDGDFPACKIESEQAVAWYTARGFSVVRGKLIDRMGHKRIPQVAAAFFAEQLGIKPLRPLEAAASLARVQMTEYHPPQTLIASMAPKPTLGRVPAAVAQADSRRKAPEKRMTLPAISRRRTLSYVSTNPGRNYPVDRVPIYDPTPERDAARTRSLVALSGAPTAAGATRIASARPRSNSPRSNWLAPTGIGPRFKARRATGSDLKGDEPSSDRRSDSPARPPPKRVEEPSEQTAAPPRRFAPRDAGPRNYDTSSVVKQSDTKARTDRAPGDREGTAPVTVANAPAAGPTQAPPARAKWVNIRLSGPSIGTSPHYLAYRVDLPPHVIKKADFLWMDNGVWMGDEPRGVKILESPGLHRISVLIVTQDNVEYRGTATVHVLERGPTASTFDEAVQ